MGLLNFGKGSDDGAENNDVEDKSEEKKDEGADDGKDKGGAGAGDKGSDDGKDKGGAGKYSEDDIKTIVQNAIDAATKGWKTEKETLEAKISELMKKGLTPEQLKELEDKEKEDAHNKREAEITDRENRFYALTAIKKAGLDDGGETALELIDLVMGKDQNEIDLKVKNLGNLVKKMVAAEVEKTFKDNGRSPESGKGADGEDKNTDIAKQLGKKAAESNKQARNVLDSYIGGKK